MMIELRAQNLSEYSICVALVLMVFIGMQFYVQRGLQGRYKDEADSAIKIIAAQAGKNVPSQYEPYYRNEKYTNTESLNLKEGMEPKGVHNKTIILDTTNRVGTSKEQINCYDDK